MTPVFKYDLVVGNALKMLILSSDHVKILSDSQVLDRPDQKTTLQKLVERPLPNRLKKRIKY